MPIKIILCLCFLVLAACSVDSEDPRTGAATSTQDTVEEDSDSVEVCNPLKTSGACPCDQPGYRCCYGYMEGYTCVGDNTTARLIRTVYESLDPCPVDIHPQCPFE
jgi:hypothetical protein